MKSNFSFLTWSFIVAGSTVEETGSEKKKISHFILKLINQLEISNLDYSYHEPFYEAFYRS